MGNEVKESFLAELKKRFGNPTKLSNSLSLFDIEGLARIYVRYSKTHPDNRTFYGLRERDLQKLAGHNSFICFLWDGQAEPLFVPYSEFEDVFAGVSPASDGQYKAQIVFNRGATELYVSSAGRHTVDAYCGWAVIERSIKSEQLGPIPDLSHSQVQSLIGAIGTYKGYDIWVPQNNRLNLDKVISSASRFRNQLPGELDKVKFVLEEIDVLWFQRGSSSLAGLFEVEHSTPIYTGLLRFNDIHLVMPTARLNFHIVANNTRRSLFVKQVMRPTFRASGLAEQCSFLEYKEVYGWFTRLIKSGANHEE
ncbi:MAG: hypothetical protein M1378_00475 [Bacteroidetes bacterium]|nr:hypothetical protein [Bacteroidota bacterium]